MAKRKSTAEELTQICCYTPRSSSSALASFRSAVSKPLVNQVVDVTFALLSATKSAESTSHLAASEQCVLRTAGTPKLRPEKENRDEHRN